MLKAISLNEFWWSNDTLNKVINKATHPFGDQKTVALIHEKSNGNFIFIFLAISNSLNKIHNLF